MSSVNRQDVELVSIESMRIGRRIHCRNRILLALTVLAAGASVLARSQQISRLDREMASAMLENLSDDVRKYYYDPKLAGLDWNALAQEAKKNIGQASDMAAAEAQIEGLAEHLNDSHTHFYPPRAIEEVDYGWSFQVFGKRVFITNVTSKSDAESKGMKPGDELLTLNGFTVDRSSASKLAYAMYLLPQSSIEVDLRDPAGKLIHLKISGKVLHGPAVYGLGGYSWWKNKLKIDAEDAWAKERAEYKEISPDLMILKVPAFFQTGPGVEALFKKARQHKTLIVDLRGTPGGTLDSTLEFLAGVFDREVKLGQDVERSKTTPLMVKGDHGAFKGDLIVLIDSESSSGAEIFARVVQLEQRGTILGDHSSGRVMASRFFMHSFGDSPVYYYGASITIANIVMTDGKSLESIGVEPDRVFLPSAADLAVGRDTLMSYAAGLAGVNLSPEDAAKLFPQSENSK